MGTTKSGRGHPNTVNQGPAPKERREDSPEYDIGGNVKERGQDPSPDDRRRGETSDADTARPVDVESARERAR